MKTITPFDKSYLPEMAALFTQNFRQLLQSVPALPDNMEDTAVVTDKLADMMQHCPGVVALENGKVAGYMGWFIVDHFRETERKGAYCPEWGHAAREGSKLAIYRRLYRAASEQWTAAGCQVHALTLLAHDHEAEKAWFWNGFGLTVVDAIRSIDPLKVEKPTGVTIRKALPGDLDAVSILEAEHWRHYTQPPVLMADQSPQDAASLADFINEPKNSIWLATDGDAFMGYMMFERNSFGACSVVEAPDKIACTGAFVRPAYRGRCIAPALLDAALRDYAEQGFGRCSVDFESFNPEAAAFWVRYFEPVCLSVLRVPERVTV